MPAFVLDASVAMSWCFPGDPSENSPYSRHILGLLATHDAIVPEIWAFEIANGIFVSHNKRKRITEPQIREYLQLLKALPIRCEPNGLWLNVGLESSARRWNLTPYDASYLDLGRRMSLPLATSDHALIEAASAERVDVLNIA